MFQHVEPAPPDAILGLTEAFKAEGNPEKINLGVGVYQDAEGKTPVLATVREATRRLSDQLVSGYLPITGAPQYAAAVQQLMFGQDHEVLTSGRAATSHTPGGTGALRVTADFLSNQLPSARVWMTDPTWANHPAIFSAAGIELKTLPYFDNTTNGLALDALLSSLREAAAGDAVLLHGCCHNPTGIDPTPAQWSQIADLIYDRGLLPILDFAYQGFAAGIDEDTAGLQALLRPGVELIVCSSFSKNFGLYRQRAGAVTFICESADRAATVQSQVKRCIRTNYSNPPAHGADLVTTILGDAALRSAWVDEVAAMRDRINGMRTLLVDKLAEHGARGDYEFVKHQRGMFSFSGLTRDEVERLKTEYAIYIVGSGRINIAGISAANVDRLCGAIAAVTA